MNRQYRQAYRTVLLCKKPTVHFNSQAGGGKWMSLLHVLLTCFVCHKLTDGVLGITRLRRLSHSMKRISFSNPFRVTSRLYLNDENNLLGRNKDIFIIPIRRPDTVMGLSFSSHSESEQHYLHRLFDEENSSSSATPSPQNTPTSGKRLCLSLSDESPRKKVCFPSRSKSLQNSNYDRY